MICFLQAVIPVTLHVGNLKVINITLKMQNFFLSIMNNKSWHSLRILNDGRSALFEEKKSVSVMEHAFYQGNVSRMFAVF